MSKAEVGGKFESFSIMKNEIIVRMAMDVGAFSKGLTNYFESFAMKLMFSISVMIIGIQVSSFNPIVY